MTKKDRQKFWPWKWNFFEKTSFRNLGPRKICPSPQTRRQVSATDGEKEVASTSYPWLSLKLAQGNGTALASSIQSGLMSCRRVCYYVYVCVCLHWMD